MVQPQAPVIVCIKRRRGVFLGGLLSDREETSRGRCVRIRSCSKSPGYQQRPREFDSLLRMLDSELRLITPTDAEGSAPAADRRERVRSRAVRAILSSDSRLFVPSLREWLTRKQKETRRGRAELLLAERAAMWNAHPNSRSLPSFLEWLIILLFTTRPFRTHGRENQNLLRAAARYYVSRMLLAVVVGGLFVWGARWQTNRSRARGLVDSLEIARTQDVPTIVTELTPLR